MTPDLSVLIVSHGSRDLTLACLASLEASFRSADGPPRIDVEVHVVDNASQDGTPRAVAERFPWVALHALHENVGFAAGCNVGLAAARGRHAVLLNSDTVVTREAFERCVEFLDANPDVGVVGPQLLHPDGRRQNSVHAFPRLATEVLPRGLLETLLPRRFPSKRRRTSGPVDVEAVLGACLFVRREVFAQVGGLPEGYFLFLEETDWCWTIRSAGWRVVHLPDAELVHVSGGSSKRKDAARTRIEYHRSLYRFLARRRGRRQERWVRAHRILRGSLEVGLLWPLALASRAQRRRWRERRTLLSWHLRGRPEGEGLAPASWEAPD